MSETYYAKTIAERVMDGLPPLEECKHGCPECKGTGGEVVHEGTRKMCFLCFGRAVVSDSQLAVYSYHTIANT